MKGREAAVRRVGFVQSCLDVLEQSFFCLGELAIRERIQRSLRRRDQMNIATRRASLEAALVCKLVR